MTRTVFGQPSSGLKSEGSETPGYQIGCVLSNPDSPDAYFQLAAALSERGDRAAARQALARAKELARGNPGSSELRQRIEALSSRLEGGRRGSLR